MIEATLKNINSKYGVCELTFTTVFGYLYMLGLELPDGVQINSGLTLEFKSSDVILSQKKVELLTRNCFEATILNIQNGEIISTLNLEVYNFRFDAIISSSLIFDFHINDKIWVYINETSIYISEFS